MDDEMIITTLAALSIVGFVEVGPNKCMVDLYDSSINNVHTVSIECNTNHQIKKETVS
jgi:hypothetical protein